jgi:peroxiredoxin Q/BCP
MTSRLWLVLLGVFAFDSARAASGMKAGDIAPLFELKTLGGETVRLADVAATSRIVLVVLRGFPGYQCPLCTRQVNDFVGRAKDFAAKEARVVMVYPGPAKALEAKAREFLASKEWPTDFVFLLDPDYAFTNAYGLRWDAPKETAYPATFVIDRDRTVRFSKISKTHGGRTTAAEILAKL